MIRVKELTFGYSETPVLKNISFEVHQGEIFGFLGPSGAGKSTLQKILIGMLTNYEGSAQISGLEIKKHDHNFYEKIGVDFEYPSLYEKLTARENLKFFSSLYQGRKRDLDELLASVGLENDADKKISEYSKGMKSRLNFIKALLHDPDILFLDEPTSGLDPNNSNLMKELIVKEREKGKTIILTTHHMEDATELCDRVAFIVEGQIKALDSPLHLIRKKSASKIIYTYIEHGEEIEKECNLKETKTDETLRKLLLQNRILTIHSMEQTLGDVFMDVTGRRLA